MNGNNDKNRHPAENAPREAPRETQWRPQDGAPSPKQVLDQSHSRFRKRKKEGVNPGIVIFILVLAAVIGVSVFVLATGRGGVSDDVLPETNTVAETEEVPQDICDYIETEPSAVHRGFLILVNHELAYEFPEDGTGPEVASVYDNCKGLLKVASMSDSLDPVTLSRLVSFASDFEERTGDRCFMVNSAYRTYGDQVSIYRSYSETLGEEYARSYVANPGFSEHHTGMAADLAVVFDDGSSVPIEEYQNYNVMREMLPSYGFILRYPEDKIAVTKIGNEPWHFRYVGTPHASVIEKTGLCFEEYVGFLKNYTADGSALYLAPDGVLRSLPFADVSLVRDSTLIYFVPKADEGNTSVPVPKNATGYQVSGNNVDGFIVTVTVGNPAETVTSVDEAVAQTAHDSVLTGEE